MTYDQRAKAVTNGPLPQPQPILSCSVVAAWQAVAS